MWTHTYTLSTLKLHPKQQEGNVLTANTALLQNSQHFAWKGWLSASLFMEIFQMHCSPQPKADPSGNAYCAYMRYVVDLNLTDFQASLIRAEQELFRKVILGYFYRKLLICETRRFSVAVYVPVFTGRVSWAQIFLDRRNTLTKKVIHPAVVKQQQLCFKSWLFALLLTNATDSCKSPVSLIQSKFGFYLGFFLVKRSFRVFIPISAAADLAVSYQKLGSERPPPQCHNKQSYFRAVMPCAQLFPVSGGSLRWCLQAVILPFLQRVM